MSLNGRTHAASPQAEVLWLMLISDFGDTREAVVVRGIDQHGELAGQMLVELPSAQAVTGNRRGCDLAGGSASDCEGP